MRNSLVKIRSDLNRNNSINFDIGQFWTPICVNGSCGTMSWGRGALNLPRSLRGDNSTGSQKQEASDNRCNRTIGAVRVCALAL